MTFALCFCNRGFMPGELIYGAREDMIKAVTDAGYDYIAMDSEATRYGGVETREEGRLYAKWLKEHEGKYDGVIFSMPIFADENGAITALQDAGVPILMQAYPDEIGKMDFANRRDAYCGKFSVTDVFTQYQVPFTVMKPHVVHPLADAFLGNLKDFAAICRVVNGMKRFNVGCIGARTTAFKTTRFDEIALQKYGITVESFDLSELVYKVNKLADDDGRVAEKIEHLKNYTDCSNVPSSNMTTLGKVSVVIDEYIDEYKLDAVTLRCWNEMETILRICPCVLLSELNDRGIAASCEIDMCSAITMRAMNLASEEPAAVLDWNNNYGDDEDKVILFHCEYVAQSLMTGKGTVTEHKMFAKGDPGSGWGSNEGRIKAFPMTFSNCQTKDGRLIVYASEAEFTDDVIEDGYFGCAGVVSIPKLQDKLIKLARGGFKHHTSVGAGHMKEVKAMKIAGLDIGTTGCKLTVFDAAGKQLGRAYRDYPIKRVAGEHVVDPLAVLDGVYEVIREITKVHKDIAGIGVTSFGETFVMTDEEGIPLHLAMLYTDPRGKEQCGRLNEVLGSRHISDISGVRYHEMYSIPKMMWIKENTPEVFAKAKHIFLMEDFIVFALTNTSQIDYSLVSRTMGFDIHKLAWSQEIFEAAGIPIRLMSNPVPSGTIAGTVILKAAKATGLSMETKIITISHDQVAAAVGAGVFDSDTAVDGAGTVECLTPVYDGVPDMEVMYKGDYAVVPYVIPGKYVCYAFSYTGGALIEWCVDTLAKLEKETARREGTSVNELLELQSVRPTGLIVLPHFAGAATPYMDTGAKGAILGLSTASTNADIYRACMEGVVYEMVLNMEYLKPSGIHFKMLNATGGRGLFKRVDADEG
ncbi:hypothetical protein MML48_scaffold00010279 [Holotrichia oblita]|nr:hypothetical protein MML48_scaffold00010279 [Holotrichia oblita]